ncbi:MAG: phosphonoacetaldehyde dehydrogenase [Rhodospirillales bacterium]|nr:phosphonoacetaldehyde dehydrogenase [Rhodospirillales bacterium]
MSSLPIEPRHEAMRIAGRKVNLKERVPVRYPYSDAVIGSVPAGSAAHACEAFDIAAAYEPKLTRYQRQQILWATARILEARKEELARMVTAELGVALADSLHECGRACEVYSLAGQLCLHDDGEIFSCDLTPHGTARKIFTLREPLRAISAITPFNHPLNTVSHKIAPAIATNNCMVVKPSELTPLTALWLADALYEAGLPPEMLSVVTGWPQDIGGEMIANPHIELITFTGGIAAGRTIAAEALCKRQVLELGGNDPLIVLNDLTEEDLAKAAGLAVVGATKHSGQRCTAVKRILCQESIADVFATLVLERAKAIRFGDPMDPATQLGSVIDAKAAEICERRVYAAAARGAAVLYDPGRRGALLPPIVVDRVGHDSELTMEETFGPVIPIVRVPDDDDVVRKIANATVYGLSAGVCTNDFHRMQAFIAGLKVGSVNIWEVPGFRIEMSPFGGIKDSGNGYKEGVIEAMKSFTNVKTFSLPWN